MNANIWIKMLNTRLLAEPNWALKAGYLVLLIAASLALAAFLILRVTVSFAGYMLVQTAKNFANTSDRNLATHEDDGFDDHVGYRFGHQGFGDYGYDGFIRQPEDDDS